MTVTDLEAPPLTEEASSPEPGAIAAERAAIDSVAGTADHKTIGRLMMGCSLAHLVVFVIFGALWNADLASGGDLLPSSLSDRFQLNHQFGIVLCGILPLLLGLAIYIVPLQVGAQSIAMPRAAALSFWAWMLASDLFLIAVLLNGAFGGGNEKMARLGNVAVGALSIALLVGAVAVVTTVISMRAPGLTLAKVPAFTFSMLVAGSLWMFTLPGVLAHVVILQISRPDVSTVTTAATDRFGWLFAQPSIYIVAIPVLGIAADVVPVMTGQRQRMTAVVQGLIGLSGLLAFGTWAQLPVARETLVWVVFAVASAIPALGLLGSLSDLLRTGGKPNLASPMLFSLLSLLLLVLAGAVGLLGGIDTAGTDPLLGFGSTLVLGQTYLVIAAAITGGLGGCFYWGTKIWGSALPDNAGRVLAPVAFLGGFLAGGAHVALAVAAAGSASGSSPDPAPYAGIAAAGLVLLGLALFASLGATLDASRRDGDGDGFADPWGGHTLEWFTTSPPPPENFTEALPPLESAEPLLDLAEAKGS